ncbi:MAG: DUF1653 domain-containing protein [Gemmataceae bacterium]
MSDATAIPPGRYRHYKGNFYEVVGIARHSETEEELVVYRALYGDGELWVRPKKTFLETVIIDGREIARFRRERSRRLNDCHNAFPASC